MKVRIYVEGGGEHEALHKECRRAFARFFEQAGLRGRMPEVIACGGRRRAFDRFRTRLQLAVPDELVVLLIDSEGLVSADQLGRPWAYLHARPDDRFDRPAVATDDQAHLMVQCMETWFLPDRQTLRSFFGQGFHDASLPHETRKPESIPKLELLAALAKSTHACKSKDEYSKGKHSFAILGRIDPDLVRRACPSAERLLATLEAILKP